MTTCQDCRRPLRDPTSVAAGRGPTCRAKHQPPAHRPRALDLPPIPPVDGQLDLEEEPVTTALPRDEALDIIRCICPPHLSASGYAQLVAELFDRHAAEVRAAHAHELAEKIRAELPETVTESLGDGIWEIRTVPTARQAADLIDPIRPTTTGA